MFKRLETRISLIIFFVMTLCVISVSIFTYITIKKYILNNLVQLSTQYVGQQNKKCQLYMNLIEETSHLVSNNPVTMSSLSNRPHNSSLASVLDGVLKSNLNILGCTVYGLNGQYYTSHDVANAPYLGRLDNHLFIHEFIASDRSIWAIRYTHSTESAVTIDYNRNHSFLSYISKITGPDGSLLGYLIIDTDILALYEIYKTNSNMFFDTASTYIITNKKDILLSPYSLPLNQTMADIIYQDPSSDSHTVLLDNQQRLLVINNLPGSEDKIVLLISLGRSTEPFKTFGRTLIIISSTIILLSFFISRILTQSIGKPLNSLYNKMSTFKHIT